MNTYKVQTVILLRMQTLKYAYNMCLNMEKLFWLQVLLRFKCICVYISDKYYQNPICTYVQKHHCRDSATLSRIIYDVRDKNQKRCTGVFMANMLLSYSEVLALLLKSQRLQCVKSLFAVGYYSPFGYCNINCKILA